MGPDSARRLRGRVEAVELYDLANDPSETTNLAAGGHASAASASAARTLAGLTVTWRGGWQHVADNLGAFVNRSSWFSPLPDNHAAITRE